MQLLNKNSIPLNINTRTRGVEILPCGYYVYHFEVSFLKSVLPYYQCIWECSAKLYEFVGWILQGSSVYIFMCYKFITEVWCKNYPGKSEHVHALRKAGNKITPSVLTQWNFSFCNIKEKHFLGSCDLLWPWLLK